jgi:hypothetical protein
MEHKKRNPQYTNITMLEGEFNDSEMQQLPIKEKTDLSVEWDANFVGLKFSEQFTKVVISCETFSNCVLSYLLKIFEGNNDLQHLGVVYGQVGNQEKKVFGRAYGSINQSFALIIFERSFHGFERSLPLFKKLFPVSAHQEVVSLYFLKRHGKTALFQVNCCPSSPTSLENEEFQKLFSSIPELPTGELINHHLLGTLMNYSQARNLSTFGLIAFLDLDDSHAFIQVIEDIHRKLEGFLKISIPSIRKDNETMKHVNSVIYASTSPLYL